MDRGPNESRRLLDESPSYPVRSVLDFYDDPLLEWTLRSLGTHLHPGREVATVHLIERAQHFGFAVGGTLLDVASGLGGPARVVARHFAATVLCVDMKSVDATGPPGGDPRRGTGPALPAHPRSQRAATDRRRSLDGAWSQDAMCHMDKPAVVAEVARVLKPGALFAFADWIARRDMSEAGAT